MFPSLSDRNKSLPSHQQSEILNLTFESPANERCKKISLSNFEHMKRQSGLHQSLVQNSSFISYQNKKIKKENYNFQSYQGVQSWLADSLKSQKSTGNEGLFKANAEEVLSNFSIGEKQLRQQGLVVSDIERLYTCLFVYSLGLNEIFNELSNKTADKENVLTNIWLVYNLLIENNKNSKYKTVVSTLEEMKNR